MEFTNGGFSLSSEKEKVHAIVCTGPSIDQVEAKMVDVQDVGPYDVLIDVAYCGINFSDIYTILGCFGSAKYPFILGTEVSGVVVDKGVEVKEFKQNDQVAVYLPSAGAFRSQLVVNSQHVYKFEKISLRWAAAIPVNYLTAHSIVKAIDLPNNQHYNNVVFVGCAGGVGLATNNLLSINHSSIIQTGVCSLKKSPNEHVQSCYSEILQYSDWDKMVHNMYNGVDVVIDTIAGSNVQRSVNALNYTGQYICIGAASVLDQNSDDSYDKGKTVDLTTVVQKALTIHGINLKVQVETLPEYTQQVMKSLNELAYRRKIFPYIHRTFPFDEFRSAFLELSGRKNVGKVLIEMNAD